MNVMLAYVPLEYAGMTGSRRRGDLIALNGWFPVWNCNRVPRTGGAGRYCFVLENPAWGGVVIWVMPSMDAGSRFASRRYCMALMPLGVCYNCECAIVIGRPDHREACGVVEIANEHAQAGTIVGPLYNQWGLDVGRWME